MKFPPLVVLNHGENKLWVAGPEHTTRSDGSSSIMVAQAFGSYADLPEGTVLTDEYGVKWGLTHGIEEGFHVTGIVLEEESV